MIDALNVIIDAAQLETTFSLYLHLVSAPLRKELHHLHTSGEMIHWPWVNWVVYTRCSHDIADESEIHLNPSSPNLGPEGIVAPLVQVGIKLLNYLLHCGAVIPYYLSPSLGIQHCPYSQCASIKI